jgi:hypothetical protein
VVKLMEEVGLQKGTPLAERRVLAFAPELLPLRLQTERQARAALMGLLQVRGVCRVFALGLRDWSINSWDAAQAAAGARSPHGPAASAPR